MYMYVLCLWVFQYVLIHSPVSCFFKALRAFFRTGTTKIIVIIIIIIIICVVLSFCWTLFFQIVPDRSTFSTHECIYPAGFCSTRVFASMSSPQEKCLYTCKISDCGDVPEVFHLTQICLSRQSLYCSDIYTWGDPSVYCTDVPETIHPFTAQVYLR